jgi:hypothetical protein
VSLTAETLINWHPLIACPYIKVDVEFAPTQEGQRVERQDDKISKISSSASTIDSNACSG